MYTKQLSYKYNKEVKHKGVTQMTAAVIVFKVQKRLSGHYHAFAMT